MLARSSSSEDESDPEVSDNESQRSLSTSGGVASTGSSGNLGNNIGRRKSLTPSLTNLTVSNGINAPGVRRQSSTGIVSLTNDVSVTNTLVNEEDEEIKRKELLQMYAFVLRCIAYSFNATYPSDIPRRYLKVTRTNLETIRQRFKSFLAGDTKILHDEAFSLSVESYCETYLFNDRITSLVKSGGCSTHDLRELFRSSIEKRVSCLPDIEGVSRETVIGSWLAKFDAIYRGEKESGRSAIRMSTPNAESFFSKDQLYDLFQVVLDVQKYEHQMLYNACQLDNADEQAAQIRRELDVLRHAIENNKLPPLEFIKNEMKLRYKEERWNAYKQLKENLEKLPLSKFNADPRPKKKTPTSILMTEESESTLSKSDTALTFTLEVIIHEVRGLSFISPQKIVYCTMEIEGGEKLRTDAALAENPIWRTQGDFKTTQPLPVLKIKLYTENKSIMSLEDKELARLTIYPNSNWSEAPEFHVMKPKHHQSNSDKMKIKVGVRMDKPQGMKKCGYLYCMGQSHWKKWKKRFFVLIQVSQYTFALCSFHTKKSDPQEMIQVDGYTVDYTDSAPDETCKGEVKNNLHHFKGVKEGDWIAFAATDENDRQLWIQKLYQATGQTHKPVPPNSLTKSGSASRTIDRNKGRKHGMEDFVQANPLEFNHNQLFKQIQSLALEKRLDDNYTSLGWLSPGQKFILDEYCARYGVRTCYRHLCYITELLNHADFGQMIDATLVQYSYTHCVSYFKSSGSTITTEEKNMFDDVTDRLLLWLTKNITHFWNCYPFGKPDGAFKATVQLFEMVKIGDGRKMESQQKEFAAEMKKLMETAALENYSSLSNSVQEIGTVNVNDYERKLDEVLLLAESCRDLLKMTEECYNDIWSKFPGLLNYHSEILWSLFSVDMDEAIDAQPEDTWNCFMLFQLLNDYLINEPNLKNGKFHQHLRNLFAPKVIRYIDLMESSIALSINVNFQKETWIPVEGGNAASEDLLYKLGKLKQFVRYLNWPDEVFGMHLTKRISLMAADMIGSCVKRTSDFFETKLKKGRRNVEYTIPSEVCVAVNVVVSCLRQIEELCGNGSDGGQHHYHTDINSYLNDTLVMFRGQLIEKLIVATTVVLNKLSNYDEGTITASIFSWMKPGNELGISFVKAIENNLRILNDKIIYEKFTLPLFCTWYEKILCEIKEWLAGRVQASLHPYQLSTASIILQGASEYFEGVGVPENTIKCRTYTSIRDHLQIEVASASTYNRTTSQDRSTAIVDESV